MNTLTADMKDRRQALVDQTMAQVHAIEKAEGVTRASINKMKDVVARLADHTELFISDEFQPARRGTFKDFVAYRLNKEDGTSRTLYLSLALPGKSSPPHNHKNWAILVGLKGVEVNRLYKADAASGFRQIDEVAVGPGVSMAMLGEDIHSIHVQGVGDEPVWQIRFYERPLEDQTERVQYDEQGNTEFFPPNTNTK